MSPSKNEEFKQLPRPLKQLPYARPEILRPAPALKELPGVLTPSNDRRVPFPPLMNYGYPLQIERMDELLERKLNCPPGVLDANPFDLIIHLQHDIFQYGVKFRTVYCNGTETFFIAISSSWKPAPPHHMEEVVKKLQDFLEVDEEPVWCLDTNECYWKK
ncbi:hypothetical protein JVT61DRAFT_7098 [Boletus reticuloceps]|uniref:Uncharacterized protein n=1 Tax=Boletus reticuloceps TaxID=495285 RepID=A0A8I3A7I5_9AGAM|nr:hypothetical protein JVT61DRAFT_7098 [Boletus reticuloceps]